MTTSKPQKTATPTRSTAEKPKKKRFVREDPDWRRSMERAQLYGTQASIDYVWASIPDEFWDSMRD